MLTWLSSLLIFIAGADKEILKDCPRTDQIWVTHIGLMLVLTFFVVSGITYLSFDYIAAIETEFNDETNKIEFGSTERNIRSSIIGILIAAVVALVITLFDRAIFQSDWYHQPVYRVFHKKTRQDIATNFIILTYLIYLVTILLTLYINEWSFDILNDAIFRGQKVDNIFSIMIYIVAPLWILCLLIFVTQALYPVSDTQNGLPRSSFSQKAIRVLIRLLISLCVAYSLSIFFELRVYEANILSKLSNDHFSVNQHLYDNFSKRVENYETEQEVKRQDLRKAEDALSKIQSAVVGDQDERLAEIERNLGMIDSELAERYAQLDLDESEQLDKLFEKRESVFSRELRQREIVAELKRKANAERRGNPEQIGGISGIVGCGANCEYYIEAAEEEEKTLNALNAEIVRLDTQMENIREDISKRRDEYRANAKLNSKILNDERQLIYTSSEELTAAEIDRLEKATLSASANLRSARQNLTEHEQNKQKFVDQARAEIAIDPEFVPFRSGPLQRLKALSDLKDDEKYGAVIVEFALWIKAFIIFLEVVPVATKVFFSPPSGYATKLQFIQVEFAEKLLASRKRLYVPGTDPEMDKLKEQMEVENAMAKLLNLQQSNATTRFLLEDELEEHLKEFSSSIRTEKESGSK